MAVAVSVTWIILRFLAIVYPSPPLSLVPGYALEKAEVVKAGNSSSAGQGNCRQMGRKRHRHFCPIWSISFLLAPGLLNPPFFIIYFPIQVLILALIVWASNFFCLRGKQIRLGESTIEWVLEKFWNNSEQQDSSQHFIFRCSISSGNFSPESQY